MIEVNELELRLDRLLKIRPDLGEAAGLQRALLREVYATAPEIVAPVLPRERGRQKLAEGVPLLHGETFDPDVAFCRDLFGRLVNALQRRPETSEAAAEIALAAAEGQLDVGRVVEEALADHGDHLAELAEWGGVSGEVLTSIAGLAVQPSLQAVAVALKPVLQTVERWPRGYCPVCGAWAGLAELQLAEQQRHLRCLRCGTDWASLRLLCPYCNNDDHGSLGYLQGEREPRFRVEICERCKGYLKAANAFESNAPAGLILDDLASIHLDMAAIERGYSRPEQHGFRIELGEPEPDEALDDLLELD